MHKDGEKSRSSAGIDRRWAVAAGTVLALGALTLCALRLEAQSTRPATETRPASTNPAASQPATQPATGPASRPASGPAADRDAKPKGPAKAWLVNADEEYAQFLADARKLINQKDYDRAIEILQAMILRKDSGFVAGEESGAYVGLRIRASELMGQLGPEGLKRYRSLYDAQAKRFYDEAMAGDDQKLRQLVDRYLYTSFGPRALNMLGATCFDQGRFSQAAICWRQLLTMPPVAESPEIDPATVLAKQAAAHHFAGEAADAAKVLEQLKARYPQALAELSGQRQNVLAFTRSILAMPVPGNSVQTTQNRGVWPGLGGAADGAALMDDCDILLDPRWRTEPPGKGVIADLSSNLLAMRECFWNRAMNSIDRGTVILFNGHVRIKGSPNRRQGTFNLAPAIQPLVYKDTVIFRTSDGICFADLLTGRTMWKGRNSLPMERDMGGMYRNDYGLFNYSDLGRYTLTLGDDIVYAVSNFRPWMPGANMGGMPPGVDKDKLVDSSELVALSIKSQGALRWQIGNGRGSDDILKAGKFLSAPTCKAGRLYVLMSYIESYHVVCIDAASGNLIWRAMISQEPASANPYGGMPMSAQRAGPPAVADGKVFAVTNAGVIAAFEADSGQPLWAHQYDAQSQGPRITYSGFGGEVRLDNLPSINPVIVLGERVFCLPADSDKLLCLSANTGKDLWTQSVSRRDQSDLSFVDPRRILLSGPDLVVLSTETGKTLFELDATITGRPAVNAKSVLASGDGKLIRLNLADYQVSNIDATSADSLLGNLVSVDGKLIAANAAGVCAYFGYEQAYQQITQRLDQAPTDQKLRLQFERARMSFNARHHAAALEDLQACEKALADGPEAGMKETLRLWMYRTSIALGDSSTDLSAMLQNFQRANSYAVTAQEKAHNMVRLMKYYLKAGDPAKSLQTAQTLSETYPLEPLVDVQIGPQADLSVRNLETSPTKPGKSLAQDFIRSVVSRDLAGREAYAAFDSQAKQALDQARQAHDATALAAVADRWPQSQWAREALFTAAQECYLQSSRLPSGQAQTMLSDANRYLAIVVGANDRMGLSAHVGQGLIWSRLGSVLAARLAVENLRDVNKQQEVAFADFHGTVAQVLKDFDAGKTPVASAPAADVCSLQLPAEQLFSLAGQLTSILTDQDYQPIRLGNSVLALRDENVVLVDTQATDEKSAVAWTGLSGIRPDTFKSTIYSPPAYRLVAGISHDRKVIALSDREFVTGLDTTTAKIVYRRKVADLGVQYVQSMSVGQGVLVINDNQGKIVCVDLSNGQTRWQAQLSRQQAPQLVAPVRITNGRVLGRCNGGRSLMCWNLQTGRLLAQFDGKTSADGCINDDGMLVTLVDQELTVRDLNDPNRPIWPRPRIYTASCALLTVAKDQIVMYVARAPEIEVLSITAGGAVLAEMKLSTQANQQAVVPVQACIDGDRLYVACGRSPNGYSFGYGMGQIPVNDPRVMGFDLTKKQLMWSRSIDSDPEKYSMPLPMIVAQKHLVFSTANTNAPRDPTNNAKIYILDSASGEIAATIDPRQNLNELAGTNALRIRYNPPVVTDGRVLLENMEGLTVYGRR